jgi:hypothetical protein
MSKTTPIWRAVFYKIFIAQPDVCAQKAEFSHHRATRSPNQRESGASIHYARRSLVGAFLRVCNRAGACGMCKLLLLCKRARCGCQRVRARGAVSTHAAAHPSHPQSNWQRMPTTAISCVWHRRDTCVLGFGVRANTLIQIMF